MATLRNKRKLAPISREDYEKNSRSSQSRTRVLPTIQGEYITQVSEELDGRVTKKLSQEFSWTENHILGVLFKLDQLVLSPQVPAHSGYVQETSWGSNDEN